MTPSVMVPLDGTESAEATLSFVESLKGEHDLHVLLVSVWDRDEQILGVDQGRRQDMSRLVECITRNLRSYLSTSERRLKGLGIDTRTMFLLGQPERDLPALAKREGADFVVLGGNGFCGPRCSRSKPSWCSGECQISGPAV